MQAQLLQIIDIHENSRPSMHERPPHQKLWKANGQKCDLEKF